MARIAGINIPLNKRVEVGLTYIYGVGEGTARKVLQDLGIDPDTYVKNLTEDEVRTLVKRQLQVEAYIQERFAPLIFISNEEIASYYNGPWSAQRRLRGLPIPPLNDVREEIRALLRSDRLQSEVERWTTQLRARANVDVYAWR